MKTLLSICATIMVILNTGCATLSAQTPKQLTALPDKTVDEYIAEPPTQVQIHEMRMKTEYSELQRALYRQIAAYYYAKGWREGWIGCSKRRPKKLKTGSGPIKIKLED